MKYKTVFTGMCLVLLITVCGSQKIIFPNEISYNGPCGTGDGQGNWSTIGTVKLSKADSIMFRSKLEIHTLSTVCTLDLTSCYPASSIPKSTGECYCQKQANDELSVHIAAKADSSQSGLSVQGLIPSHDKFGSVAFVSSIGKIPIIPEKRPSVRPTYQVDDGVIQPLLANQIIEVCNIFVTVTICIEEKALGSMLQVSFNRKNLTTYDNCLKFIESTSPKEIKFAYKESSSCPPSHVSTLVIREKRNGCHVSTSPNTTTIPEPTQTSAEPTAAPTTVLQTCQSQEIADLLAPGMVQICGDKRYHQWTIIQKRISGDVDFYKNWSAYENGFGNQPKNFWLGLKAIHQLCAKLCHIRFDLKYKGADYFAQYDNFSVEGAGTDYTMFVSGYHGDAGDDEGFSRHDGSSFSTFDRDNDHYNEGDCAKDRSAGFWFDSCNYINLNGVWASNETGKGLTWGSLTGWGESVTFSEIKVRQGN